MKQTKALGRLRPDHYLVTTLVSTQMARALAEREGVRIEDDLLVGFKWIAQRIDERGPAGFLFGFEESHGYLKGTHVRDKDAAVAVAALRRAGRDREGPQADRAGIPRRPLHRRRPLRRAADQQDHRRAARGSRRSRR